MEQIVRRLQENRNIERAKSILESNGYKVTKKVNEGIAYRKSMNEFKKVDEEQSSAIKTFTAHTQKYGLDPTGKNPIEYTDEEVLPSDVKSSLEDLGFSFDKDEYHNTFQRGSMYSSTPLDVSVYPQVMSIFRKAGYKLTSNRSTYGSIYAVYDTDTSSVTVHRFLRGGSSKRTKVGDLDSISLTFRPSDNKYMNK